MRSVVLALALVVAACPQPTQAPATTGTIAQAPPPMPPPPPPRPAQLKPRGQWCWISEPRKSGCTVEQDECQKDADEMRSRPDTKIASECSQQSPVHCYQFADQDKPLCYASLGDCNDGRARMADFGTTTECQPKP